MSKLIVEMMRKEYTMRLLEALTETDLMDKSGKVVVGSGLKVRHKDSQLEYTVDSVEQDESGDYKITLRNPDAPRFDPAPSDPDALLDETDGLVSSPVEDFTLPLPDMDSDIKVSTSSDVPPVGPEDLIVIDQAEFEKDYEVK